MEDKAQSDEKFKNTTPKETMKVDGINIKEGAEYYDIQWCNLPE